MRARVEYVVSPEGFLVFPANSSVLGEECGRAPLHVAVVPPDGISVRVDYAGSRDRGVLNVSVTLEALVYAADPDGAVSVEPACNETLTVTSSYEVLPGGVVLEESKPQLAPLFLAPAAGGVRVAFPIVYTGVRLEPSFDSEEEAERVAALLEDALREAGLEGVVGVVTESEGSRYTVYLAASPMDDVEVLELAGYAASIAPPPGKAYTAGNLTLSPLETALPGPPEAPVKLVGPGAMLLRAQGVYYAAYFDGSSLLTAALRDLSRPEASPAPVSLLYHWETGLLLEANLSMLPASTLLHVLGLDKAANHSYPVHVGGLPLTIIAGEADEPGKAAALLDPDAAHTAGAAYAAKPVEATIRATTLAIERSQQPSTIHPEQARIPAAAALAATAALAITYLLARRPRTTTKGGKKPGNQRQHHIH